MSHETNIRMPRARADELLQESLAQLKSAKRRNMLAWVDSFEKRIYSLNKLIMRMENKGVL